MNYYYKLDSITYLVIIKINLKYLIIQNTYLCNKGLWNFNTLDIPCQKDILKTEIILDIIQVW